MADDELKQFLEEDKYDDFIKKDFVVEELLHVINNNELKEIYFDWNMFSNNDVEKLNKLFTEITSLDKRIKVILQLNKFTDFYLLNIQNYINKNIEFIFSFMGQSYTCEEYINLDNKLNKLLENITSDMTSYEKYKIIYDKVRNFREYKIIDTSKCDLASLVKAKWQSCSLKNIFENDYIDCAGYSLLLETLLNKVGIEASKFSFEVFDDNKNLLGGHCRTLINLDDDEYDIHGLFISDPTWDQGSNQIQYSLLPLSSMKDPIYSECNETILYDIDESTDFSNIVNKLNKSLFNSSITEYIIQMINKIDRKESEKLSTLNDEDFNKELVSYICERNNKPKEKIL